MNQFSKTLLIMVIVIGLSWLIYWGTLKPYAAAKQGRLALIAGGEGKDLEEVLEGFKKVFAQKTFVSNELRFILTNIISQEYGKVPQERIEKLIKFDIEELEKSIKAHPQEMKWRLTQGSLYSLLARSEPNYFEEAEQVFKKVIKMAPKRIEPYLELADIKLRQEKYDEALPFYQKAVELNRDFSRTHWELGQYYFAIGEQKRGVAEIVEAIGLGFDWHNLNRLQYAQKEDFQALIEALKEKAKENPKYSARYWLAIAVFSFNRLADINVTIEYLEKAIKFHPGLKGELGDFLEKLKTLRAKGVEFKLKE